MDAQAKELSQWKQRVEDLEEKERVANENVGSRFCLINDISHLRITSLWLMMVRDCIDIIIYLIITLCMHESSKYRV